MKFSPLGSLQMPIDSRSSSCVSSLAPIESVVISVDLDGQHGTNRATGNHPQISAQNDIDAIKAWLARFADTKTTFDNYRKEAERLLLWSTVQQQKPISSLTHEDLLRYQHFLGDPQPAARWIMRDGRKFGRSHAEWRPFAGPLSPSSRRQAFIILNTLFSWLVNAGYLAGNPLSLARQRTRKAKPRESPAISKKTCGPRGQADDRFNAKGDRSGTRTLFADALAIFIALPLWLTHLGGRRKYDGSILLPPRQRR